MTPQVDRKRYNIPRFTRKKCSSGKSFNGEERE
jgi:hypothetical protein